MQGPNGRAVAIYSHNQRYIYRSQLEFKLPLDDMVENPVYNPLSPAVGAVGILSVGES
jgi:hypothetical protein